MTEESYVSRLREAVAEATPRLALLTEGDAALRPAPGKWSPREILGHLVDSAITNHQRFLRAVAQDDLVFPGYPQDEWVALQAYQNASWSDLVALWRALNQHIARVMPLIPRAVRARAHTNHNLGQLAFIKLTATQPATLDYLMADYVAHLEHHLRQIPGAHSHGR